MPGALIPEELSLYEESFPDLCSTVLAYEHGQMEMLMFDPYWSRARCSDVTETGPDWQTKRSMYLKAAAGEV